MAIKNSISVEEILDINIRVRRKDRPARPLFDKALKLGALANVLEQLLTEIPFRSPDRPSLAPSLHPATFKAMPNALDATAHRMENVNSSKFINLRTILVDWIEGINCLSEDEVPEPLKT